VSYDAVVQILRDSYGWPLDCAPEPSAVAESTADDESIAAMLDGYCWTAAANYGWGGVEPGSQGAYVQCRHLFFAEHTKFWRSSTRLALGAITELPEDKIAPAHTVTEWAANLALGRDYMGYKNHDPASEDGAMRRAKANAPPMEVVDTGLSRVWYFFALSGYDFSLDNYRGLDAQQALDNLWAGQKGLPIPWLPVTRAN
jgi:hypothetical protein